MLRSARIWSALLVVACTSPSSGVGSPTLGQCIDVPSVGSAVAPQGKTDQGKTDQGKTDQGNVNQGKTDQGTGKQAITARGYVLHQMNGAALRLGAKPVHFEQGRLAADRPMEGADLTLGVAEGSLSIHVDALQTHANFTTYGLSVGGHPVCLDGEQGLFIEGGWDSRGRRVVSPGTVTFACMSGVIAKCVSWGYAPWSAGAAAHQACTRLARADYCGNGESWTREGTTINVYDDRGIQTSTPSSSMSFEAGWGPEGAVCVNEPRFRIADADGTELLPHCWTSLPRCGSLAEARTLGASLVNESAHDAACARR